MHDDLLMALRPRQRATLFLTCCVLALLAFHLSFLAPVIGRSLAIPLVAALGFSIAAGGYAWPPIGNKTAWLEAAELVGWSERRARRSFIGINVLTWSLLFSAGLFFVKA